PATRSQAARRSSVRTSSGRAPRSTYCFGRSPPKRAPRPAAGTTHHRRSPAAIALLAVLRRRGSLVDDLVERLARLQQADLGARALLDRLLAVLEVLDLGRQRVVARLQLRVLRLLLLDALAQAGDVVDAALPGP